MKKFNKILLASCLLTFGIASAQTGIGTTTPDASAVLDVSSSTKGLLMPRLTTSQRNAISLPATGLVVYNTTSNELQTNTGTTASPIWTASGIGPTGATGAQGVAGDTGATGAAGTNGTNGATWTSGSGAPSNAVGTNGDHYLNTASGDVYLKASNVYSIVGNIKGATGATGAQGIQGIQGAAGTNGTNGTNATVTGSAPIAVSSGVVSLNDSGVTSAKILDGTVTTADLANNSVSMAKISATGTADSTTYLRGDGSWSTVASASAGTVTNVSVTTANGISGSVLNPTDTPAITLTLGDITPTSVVTSGNTTVNGVFKSNGAVYAKVRTVTSLPITWAADDYMIIVKVAAAQNLILPDPALYSGRVICIRNGSVSAGTSGTYTYITYVPQDVTTILANRGQTFVSDGTKWFLISGV